MRDRHGSINGIPWVVSSLGQNIRVTIGNRNFPASGPKPTFEATTETEAGQIADFGDALQEGAAFLSPALARRRLRAVPKREE